ncbi:uncharacterized protein [Procambarus clarkii]|uniref:uncharacterized protein n=1 Tax=Procambarus clarkii TaxID=6728 RepID=UPI0037435CBA
MVVCPCGVMVPVAGVGRFRRATRTPSCFDTSSTVTTQPKDTQEPASVDKLTAATNDPSGIPRPLSRTSKNKGTSKSCEEKSEHTSRTTLALATTESGRYVGTRPLRSNRSPTPTLHTIPLRTSRDQKNTTSNGRPTKHLPAVRTSPTSPLEKQQGVHGPTRDSNRVRGPMPLPRNNPNNPVNHRINDMNASNQRRLLKQTLSPGDTQLRTTTLSATKTFKTCLSNPITSHIPIYENLGQTWQTENEMIYENLRPGCEERDPDCKVPGGVDVMEREMESATHPAAASLSPFDADASTVWLSDSWKYNTIKRAPDLNLIEFSELDPNDDNEVDNINEQQTIQVKEKRRFRSRLPMFGRKRDKENKGKVDTAFEMDGQGLKYYKKRTHKHADGPESPASTHKAKISRPLANDTIVSTGGARSKESSPHSSDNENKVSKSSSKWRTGVSLPKAREELDPTSWWSSDSSDTSSVSTLISPCPSPRYHHLQHPDGVSPSPSLTHSKRHSYLHDDEEWAPMRSAGAPRRDQRGTGSLDKVSCGVGEEDGHLTRHTHSLRGRASAEQQPCSKPAQHPAPTRRGRGKTSQAQDKHSSLPQHTSRQGRQAPSPQHTPQQLTSAQDPSTQQPPQRETSAPASSTQHDGHSRETFTGDVSCHQVSYQHPSQPRLHAFTHASPRAPPRPSGTSTQPRPPGTSTQPRPSSPTISLHCMPAPGDVIQESGSGPKEEKRSQIPTFGHKKEIRSQSLTVGLKQEVITSTPTVDTKHKTRPQAATVGLKQVGDSKLLSLAPKEERLTQVDSVSHKQEAHPRVATSEPQQETQESRAQLLTVDPERGTCSQISFSYSRGEEATGDLVGDDYVGEKRCSGVSIISPTSPVLPPLPPELLHDSKANSPPDVGTLEVTFPKESAKLTSVCILSLDLTVDYEEINRDGLTVVNIIENELPDLGFSESNADDEEILMQDEADVFQSNELHIKTEETRGDAGVEPRPLSSSSSNSSVSFEDKYYKKDDYDSPEGGAADDMSVDADHSLGFGCPSDDTSNKKTDDANPTADEDDFIEIDCDVQPMETLKRPLVYGYGSGPVRSHRGSFLEKRLSQASDVSDYLEMDLLESLLKRGVGGDDTHSSEGCLDLRETYWDHWQAKQNAIENQINKSRQIGDPVNNRHSSFPNCPSSKFCYDPEVLLAQVRCPKSLEDATFKQYSAYVKSQIYDHIGNVHESLKEYGLSYGRPDWTSSQPELPDLPRNRRDHGKFPLDYSSEPELSKTGEKRQPRTATAQSLPQHPPATLNRRDASFDSGTWTYLPSSEESTVAPSPLTCYPVPLPRSTSSLSHIGPGVFSPWHHLLPDVTPPRTPRHSAYYTSGSSSRIGSPSGSRPASPTLSRCSLSSRTSAYEPRHDPNWESSPRHDLRWEPAPRLDLKRDPTPQHTVKWEPSPRRDLKWESAPRHNLKWEPSPPQAPAAPHTPSKKSFLPNFSAVMRSPLRKQNTKMKTGGEEDTRRMSGPAGGPARVTPGPTHPPDKPTPHHSIQNRRLTTISSKSSSSSSSSSSASSKDSVKTVIPAPARSKGPNWLMKHFGGSKNRGSTPV